MRHYLTEFLNTFKFVKNTPLYLVFSTLLSEFGKLCDQTYFVFDTKNILLNICLIVHVGNLLGV